MVMMAVKMLSVGEVRVLVMMAANVLVMMAANVLTMRGGRNLCYWGQQVSSIGQVRDDSNKSVVTGGCTTAGNERE